jgi:Ca-activated chloride channel family protein
LEIPSQPQQRPLNLPRQQAAIPSPRLQPQPVRPTQLVTVTVTDPGGGYVPGLRREDFVLYEDGVRQEITYFNIGENEPVSLGLVVDTSGSMRDKIEYARQALRRFVDSIRPGDEVFVEEFNVQPVLLQDFTDSRVLLAQAIALLRPAGGTALYDAILDGVRRIKRGRHQKRALVVLSDGMDTASLSSLRQALEVARRSGVLIYTIGIGNPQGFHAGGGGVTIGGPFGAVLLGTGVDDRVDTRTLQTISDETGAQHFLLNTRDVVGSSAVLETAIQTISRELRLQYSLGYTSSSGGDGYRSIRVETPHHNLVVRAQRGYAVD